MKKVDCYLCSSNRFYVLFKQQGYDSYLAKVFSKPPAEDLNWVVCTDCGFVYRTPVLEDNELSMLYRNYDKDIFLNTTPDAYFEKIVSLSNDESENWQKVEWLGNILSKHKLFDTCKSVLDVGCGGGTLLYTIKQQLEVEKVCGVELNSAYADLASTKLNADIKNENYKSGLFKDKFDLIVNTKVLEHVSDPLPFLQEIENDLGEEGVFFIEVPDISDMYNLPPNHERFFIPHIYFFSTKSLSTLLEKSGFNVIEKRVVKTSRNRAYLQILAIKKSEKISKTILDTVNDNYTEIRRRVKENIEQHNAN